MYCRICPHIYRGVHNMASMSLTLPGSLPLASPSRRHRMQQRSILGIELCSPFQSSPSSRSSRAELLVVGTYPEPETEKERSPIDIPQVRLGLVPERTPLDSLTRARSSVLSFHRSGSLQSRLVGPTFSQNLSGWKRLCQSRCRGTQRCLTRRRKRKKRRRRKGQASLTRKARKGRRTTRTNRRRARSSAVLRRKRLR